MKNNVNLAIIMILTFALGSLTGQLSSDHNYIALRMTMIEEMQGFISDMEWDIKDGRLDSSTASYYIHNFNIIEKHMTDDCDDYISWYE